MQVVGTTNEHEIWASSGERSFRLNELLIIEDSFLNYPVGEVIETYSVNPFIPSIDEKTPVLVDGDVMDVLNSLGYEIADEMIYFAKLRIISELFYPVKTGANIREPEFEEVRDLLIRTLPPDGLTVGVIQGTEGLTDSLPIELQQVSPLFDTKKGIMPQVGVPFVFDYKSMNNYPHIGIFGGSGSGKSFGLRVLIEELMEKKVPLLVFDPHYEMSFKDVFDENLPDDFKGDYDRSCLIVTVGVDAGVKFDTLTSGDLCNLLGAVSPITEAMESAVSAVLERRDHLALFQDRIDSLIKLLESPNDDHYRQEFMDRTDIEEKRKNQYWNKLLALKKQVGQISTLKSITWRLSRLVRQGIFMDKGIKRIEEGLKAQKTVIIRGTIWMLRVYAAYVLRSVYQKRRDYRDAVQKGQTIEEKFPPFVVITDEAHNFAPKGDFNVPSKREMREIAQEGRKYGVFLILASQRPALLDDTINAQLNTKIIFRTVRSTDLNVIREETDIASEDVKRLPYLPSGTGYISSPVIGRTMSIKVRVSKTRSPHQLNPFDELEEQLNEHFELVTKIINDYLPLNESNLIDIILRLEKEEINLSEIELINYLEKMAENGIVRKETNPLLGITYKGE
ncbi:MAG TPA: ATP-binding protein [Syntrophomonadaceae bacterium]|nr:ATP-binding protein [Syntrophomonadaceae bacterium]